MNEGKQGNGGTEKQGRKTENQNKAEMKFKKRGKMTDMTETRARNHWHRFPSLLLQPHASRLSLPAAMTTLVVMMMLLLSAPLLLSSALPFQQKGFLDFGEDIDVRDLMTMMIRDQEEGSGFEDVQRPEVPTCPFGCVCHLKVVQCSDLG